MTKHKRILFRAVFATSLPVLPKRILTMMAGHLLRSRVSRLAIPVFAAYYHISLDESELAWTAYPSLSAFFSRRLLPGSRTFAADSPAVIISPVDALVSACGEIGEGTLLQVKGQHYSLHALLAKSGADYLFGHYLTLYLSPRDYHRIHIPATALLTNAVHIPGTLYPVNRLGTQYISGLFTRNERVVCEFEQDSHTYAVIAVGSFIVGSIQLADETGAVAPRVRSRGSVTSLLKQPVSLAKGAELGWFEFGSTVLLLFPKGQVELSVQEGDRVQALQPLGRWVNENETNAP